MCFPSNIFAKKEASILLYLITICNLLCILGVTFLPKYDMAIKDVLAIDQISGNFRYTTTSSLKNAVYDKSPSNFKSTSTKQSSSLTYTWSSITRIILETLWTFGDMVSMTRSHASKAGWRTENDADCFSKACYTK